MLLLALLARADDMAGVCVEVTEPADVRGYADVGELGTEAVGQALAAEAEAWLTGACAEESCGEDCVRETCAPEAGVTAVRTEEAGAWRIEVTRDAGDWTRLVYDSLGYQWWSASWDGVVDPELPADSEAEGWDRVDGTDDMSGRYEGWADPACTWSVSYEAWYSALAYEVRVSGQPDVTVRTVCWLVDAWVWIAEVDGVSVGLVDADTWEPLYAGAIDADGDGLPVEAGDCDDADASVNPCRNWDTPNDGIDQDCEGGDAIDADGDGWPAGGDCDDTNPAVHYGVEEIPYDGIDQDCVGGDENDLDRDGYPFPDDCDDDDFLVYPDAWDFLCDGVDQDCDGADRCDEGQPAQEDDGGCGSGGAAWLLFVPIVRRGRRRSSGRSR